MWGNCLDFLYVIHLKTLPWNGLKYKHTFSQFNNQNLTADLVTNVALHVMLLNKHPSGKPEGTTGLAFLLQFQV